jgi:hypothetical protein
MNDQQFELTNLYFEKKASNADIKSLLAELESDSGFLKEFLEEWESHWLLKHVDTDQQVFLTRVLHFVDASNDQGKFLQGIRHRVDRERSQKRKVIRFITAISTMAALVVAALTLRHYLTPATTPNISTPVTPQLSAVVTSAKHPLKLYRNGKEMQIELNAQIMAGDRVIAGTKDRPILQTSDGSTFQLNGGSILEFPKSGRVNFASVVDGDVYVHAAPQSADRPLSIGTPGGVEATVLGTKFEISVKGGRTRLAVEEGLVRFGRVDSRLLVKAGMQSEATGTGEPAQPSPLGAVAVAAWRLEKKNSPALYTNLLSNSSFEEGFKHWEINPPNAVDATCVIAPRDDGETSLVLRVPESASFSFSQTVPINGGMKYRASAVVYTRLNSLPDKRDGTFSITLHFLDSTGRLIKSHEIARSVRGEYKELAGNVISPRDSVKLKFEITSVNAFGHVDDCELVLTK